MLRTLVMPLILLLAATSLPAGAQSSPPETDNGRYSLTPIDDGFLRLDTRTGRVSVCARRTMGWSCHPVPDERAALEEEIARLQRDNAALKKDMLARGIVPPGGPAVQAPVPPAAPVPGPAEKPTLKGPSEAELDRAVAVIERVWKKLVEMVQRWQREMTPI
ncbi:MAG: hypothetical protein ACOY5F_14955 [Pseudomonadota bacterium]